MYEGVRGALAADDALAREHCERPFRVRETHEWKLHAADLEFEMLKRMTFDLIDWSEDQTKLPFEERTGSVHSAGAPRGKTKDEAAGSSQLGGFFIHRWCIVWLSTENSTMISKLTTSQKAEVNDRA